MAGNQFGLIGIMFVSVVVVYYCMRNGGYKQLPWTNLGKGFTSGTNHTHTKTKTKEPKGCKVHVIDGLEKSGLRDIQKERKVRIKKVCEMCRHSNRSPNDCKHIRLSDSDGRHYGRIKGLLVDDKHKVTDSK